MSETALETAIRMLSARLYSEKELERKLMQKAYSESDISYAMEKLRSYRYVDDRHYSEAVARHYTRKGYGKKRIRDEFCRRGIPEEYWEQAISSLEDSRSVLDSYFLRRLNNPDDPAELRKLGERLYRRGFSWQEIMAAINRIQETR